MQARALSDPATIAEYRERGAVVVSRVVESSMIDKLLDGFLAFVHETTGRRFDDPYRGAIISFFRDNPDAESAVYDGVRRTTLLAEATMTLVELGGAFAGPGARPLAKIPFRIDLPYETRELAHWHQDRFYVKGDPRTVTVWAPLQNTGFEQGCVAVMPGTHELGLLDHDVIIEKRHVPSSVLDREIRLAPVAAGDALVFHADLVHSSTLNVSDSIRYSIQPRFVPAGGEHDPDMGGLLPLEGSL